MANDQIVFNVGVKLDVIQSSVSELQKILQNLQPNSKGFKDLDRVVSALSKTMGDLQQRSAKGFVNENQINQAAKLIEKMEMQLEGAQQVVNGLKFSDLQLDTTQLDTINQFRDQLKAIDDQFAAVKEQAKQGLLSDQNTKTFLSGPIMSMVNDLDKDFDTIAAKVDKKVAELRQRAENARQNSDQALAEQARVNLAMSDPMQTLSQMDRFSKFFQNTKNGVRFATSGFGAGEVKQQFFAEMQNFAREVTNGHEPAFDALANATYSQINEAFKNNPQFRNIFETFFNVADIDRQVQSTGAAQRIAEANYQQAENIRQRIAAERSDSGSIGQAERQHAADINSVTEALRVYQQAQTDSVRNNQAWANSFAGSQSQLQSFCNELANVNTEMLRVQGAQRNFNSLKMAVTNFMGFNQILNLTKRAINEAAQHIQKLDSIMNQIAVVTDMSTADLWDQVDVYSEIAQNYGVTIEGAYEVSKIFYMQGRFNI